MSRKMIEPEKQAVYYKNRLDMVTDVANSLVKSRDRAEKLMRRYMDLCVLLIGLLLISLAVSIALILVNYKP